MINAIFGKKIGMTQIFNEEDKLIPVTVIQAEPNTVCQVKTKATDGYEAVQLGFGEIKAKKVNKPMGGHFAKQGIEPTRYLREVRVEDAAEYKAGDQQTVAAFAEVKKVDVTGISMGCDTVTVKNLTVMRVDEEQNLILVKGAIPGGKNGIVRVRMA